MTRPHPAAHPCAGRRLPGRLRHRQGAGGRLYHRLLHPRLGNVIGGTGVSIKLRGHTAREMAIPGSEQMKFAFGENPKRNYGARKQTPATRMGVAGILRETLFNAKQYSDKLKAAESDPSKAPEPNFQLNALVPVVRGQMRCRMHAHRSDDILTAISIAEEFGLDYVIEHCTEGYKIADVLNEKQVRCVIGPHLTAPSKMEIHGRSLDTPGILAKEPDMTVALTADTGSQTSVLPMTIACSSATASPLRTRCAASPSTRQRFCS